MAPRGVLGIFQKILAKQLEVPQSPSLGLGQRRRRKGCRSVSHVFLAKQAHRNALCLGAFKLSEQLFFAANGTDYKVRLLDTTIAVGDADRDG